MKLAKPWRDHTIPCKSEQSLLWFLSVASGERCPELALGHSFHNPLL